MAIKYLREKAYSSKPETSVKLETWNLKLHLYIKNNQGIIKKWVSCASHISCRAWHWAQRDILTVWLLTIKLHFLCLKHTTLNCGFNIILVSHTCNLPSCTSNVLAISFGFVQILKVWSCSAWVLVWSFTEPNLPLPPPTHWNFHTLFRGTVFNLEYLMQGWNNHGTIQSMRKTNLYLSKLFQFF